MHRKERRMNNDVKANREHGTGKGISPVVTTRDGHELITKEDPQKI
jgi:hypothetical protein